MYVRVCMRNTLLATKVESPAYGKLGSHVSQCANPLIIDQWRGRIGKGGLFGAQMKFYDWSSPPS